jgi:hypothetical protein
MTHGAIYPCFKTFLFFALQPLGFWIEGHVLGLRVNDGTRSNGTSTVAIQPRGTSKTAPDSNQTPTSTFVRHPWLGYVWVTTWLCLTARLYFGEMVASGFYDQGGWVAIPILTRFVSIARHA